MKSHTCVNGRTIEYDPTPAEERFLAKVAAAVDDPKIKAPDMLALVYGPENPLLESKAGYHFVTPAAFENPVYRVLGDLIDRKNVALGTLDLEKAAAKYTLTVGQAAEKAGVATSAIRTAVIAGRLPSWMKDGQIYLEPQSVAAYQADRRGGRPPQLIVTCGNQEGASMRVRVVNGELEVSNKSRGVVDGLVKKWDEVVVITSAKRENERSGGVDTSLRFWRIKPGGSERRIELGPFKVVGRFTIEEQKNGKAANEAWRAVEHLPGA